MGSWPISPSLVYSAPHEENEEVHGEEAGGEARGKEEHEAGREDGSAEIRGEDDRGDVHAGAHPGHGLGAVPVPAVTLSA